MELKLRIAQVLKQEADNLGYEGKEILEYVKEHHKLDKKEGAAWRNIWFCRGIGRREKEGR